jgi:putative redox protein
VETSSIIYLGELRTSATHLKSGSAVITDAPVDNHGKGEAFSPTDLAATSLGSCMITIMGIAASKNDMNIDGCTARITKIMGENPRRIVEIVVDLHIPDRGLSDQQKRLLENAGRNCPVAKSLHPDINQNISFSYKRVETVAQ